MAFYSTALSRRNSMLKARRRGVWAGAGSRLWVCETRVPAAIETAQWSALRATTLSWSELSLRPGGLRDGLRQSGTALLRVRSLRHCRAYGLEYMLREKQRSGRRFAPRL